MNFITDNAFVVDDDEEEAVALGSSPCSLHCEEEEEGTEEEAEEEEETEEEAEEEEETEEEAEEGEAEENDERYEDVEHGKEAVEELEVTCNSGNDENTPAPAAKPYIQKGPSATNVFTSVFACPQATSATGTSLQHCHVLASSSSVVMPPAEGTTGDGKSGLVIPPTGRVQAKQMRVLTRFLDFQAKTSAGREKRQRGLLCNEETAEAMAVLARFELSLPTTRFDEQLEGILSKSW
ncbi:hypothetical protein TraAM80_05922 [Trypanosoma rangeli]|uniref:Uncharacterized protein n=1 Tax=Trypanosoma rangeli TaxID=5698 RepID=A0A3R7K859_TRYRA|nr:uncharacterized protein TraAM80_05922 [Trypanosoma rangeli]RNF03343.1 hypothetical protein TraAM80_05922 [Trypanosoma rangeli]|eukprot:RNF03343.1 hypothetical protein TraAM80_05922 [Trypanosoma rangeli]